MLIFTITINFIIVMSINHSLVDVPVPHIKLPVKPSHKSYTQPNNSLSLCYIMCWRVLSGVRGGHGGTTTNKKIILIS